MTPGLWLTPIFDTATDTVTDSLNIRRENNMLQDAVLPS